ncbi:MAG: hypothetical protein DRP35_05285 [Candidatus Zixiibacteriota bacterium]|nr:MAG: hypothetical protein DRP35_05285 [candidate division Zixibacteria bacterium]
MSGHASKRPERKMKSKKHFSKRNSNKPKLESERPKQIKNKKEKYIKPAHWEETIEEFVEETMELSVTE